MGQDYSNRVQDVIRLGRDEAMRLSSGAVEVEHLVLGIIHEGGGPAINILRDLGCDIDRLKSAMEDRTALQKDSSEVGLPMSDPANRVLELAQRIATERQDKTVRTDHLLLAILQNERSNVDTLFQSEPNITVDSVASRLGKDSLGVSRS